MLEPTATPEPLATPIYWLDQIDVAVELPMGPQGEQGEPGTKWIVGPGLPPAEGEYAEGTMFLSGDGSIWVYEDGIWQDTHVDLLPDAAEMIPHEHPYLPLSGGRLTGPITGTDATFSGNVVVPTPDAPEEAVNVAYLDNEITALELSAFFGDSNGNANSTASSWNAATGQAIYQQIDKFQLPPGVSGKTIGLVMKQSNGNITQFISDIARNLWFVRTQVDGQFGQWASLSTIVRPTAPLDPPGGPAVPHGTIWIQTDSGTF